LNKVQKGTPVSVKTQAQESSISLASMDDQLAVSPKLIAEIEAKGLVHRWINAVKYKSNYGYDSRQWQPYQVKKNEGVENNFYGFTDSEGYIRRGDLILAVRKKEVNDLVKARNANKIKNLAGTQRKQAKEQIKQSLKSADSDSAKIYDDYDENE
jgi:hypothetical protein